jgi:glyoxylase-like metal-dependent hydrolase (beta-lactamase superfamily II)
MLDLIDLDIPSLGYSQFISAWVYNSPGGSFLVDPGPACTIPNLLEALEQRRIRHLDWILLTHIHIDHAGGIGHLVSRFPGARVVCHERAVSHLTDPARLWEGSLKVLGRVAQTYGEIKPIPAENIVAAAELEFEDGIRVVDSPGHAVHHQCFVFKDWIFCGELFGIMLARNEHIYLRPATPPRIDLEALFASMHRMEPEMNRRICFGHYGQFLDGPRILSLARTQLELWIDVIRRYAVDSDKKKIMAELMDADKVYAGIKDLPPLLFQRESFFSLNAINGILQALNPGSDN